MKIEEIKVFLVHQFVYVKIETDEGIYGIGEASLRGRSIAVYEALGHIKPLLIGQDPTQIEHIWQDIFRGTFWARKRAQYSLLISRLLVKTPKFLMNILRKGHLFM